MTPIKPGWFDPCRGSWHDRVTSENPRSVCGVGFFLWGGGEDGGLCIALFLMIQLDTLNFWWYTAPYLLWMCSLNSPGGQILAHSTFKKKYRKKKKTLMQPHTVQPVDLDQTIFDTFRDFVCLFVSELMEVHGKWAIQDISTTFPKRLWIYEIKLRTWVNCR